jgi:hypothetical protein
VLGWIALAVLVAAGAYVVFRMVRSWMAAARRYGGGSGDGADRPGPDGPSVGPGAG